MCLFRWLSFAYQWCSAPHSSPLGIHIFHLYKFHVLCSGDDKHVGHRLSLSSPLHSDMLRQCIHHECHSLQHILLEKNKTEREVEITQYCLLPSIVMKTNSIWNTGAIIIFLNLICLSSDSQQLWMVVYFHCYKQATHDRNFYK